MLIERQVAFALLLLGSITDEADVSEDDFLDLFEDFRFGLRAARWSDK